MKAVRRATLKSLAIWVISSASMIIYQFIFEGTGRSLPFLSKNAFISINIVLLIVAVGLMRRSPQHIIFPSPKNTTRENGLNTFNIAFSVLAAVCYIYLGGFFGPAAPGSLSLYGASAALGAYLLFEVFFVLYMDRRESLESPPYSGASNL